MRDDAYVHVWALSHHALVINKDALQGNNIRPQGNVRQTEDTRPQAWEAQQAGPELAARGRPVLT